MIHMSWDWLRLAALPIGVPDMRSTWSIYSSDTQSRPFRCCLWERCADGCEMHTEITIMQWLGYLTTCTYIDCSHTKVSSTALGVRQALTMKMFELLRTLAEYTKKYWYDTKSSCTGHRLCSRCRRYLQPASSLFETANRRCKTTTHSGKRRRNCLNAASMPDRSCVWVGLSAELVTLLPTR